MSITRPRRSGTEIRFGSFLRSLRLARGLSQTEVGNSLGLHRTQIGWYEQGRILPALDTFERLVHFYNTDPAHLLSLLSHTPTSALPTPTKPLS